MLSWKIKRFYFQSQFSKAMFLEKQPEILINTLLKNNNKAFIYDSNDGI